MDELQQFKLNKILKVALASAGYKNSEVGEVGEDTIYTNEEIKKNFLDAISEQDTFKPIIKTVSRLIEIDVIVPVHVTKPGLLIKIISLFFKGKDKFAQSKTCMAFFDFNSGKIFVLIENIDNMNYWKKSEALSLVLLHEFQHMTSSFFPISFIRLHAKSLISYYKEFFKLYFKVKVSDRETYKLVNWLHIHTETARGRLTLGNKTIDQYYSLMWTMLKPHYKSTDQLKFDLYQYFKSMLLYWNSPSASIYIQALNSKNIYALKLYFALRASYKALKIFQRVGSIFIQETLFPGEVICLESEFNTQPRHFKLITAIKK